MSFVSCLSCGNIFFALLSFIPAKFAGDLSFLLLFIGGSLALSFVLGRTRLLSVVVFSYGTGVCLALPASWLLSLRRAIAFLVLLSALVMVGDYILDIHISNPTSTFFSRVLVMGCLGTGLAMSMALSLVVAIICASISLADRLRLFLSDSWARLVWMAAPLLFCSS